MKKLLTIFVSILMVLSLVACTNSDKPTAPQEKTKVTIWHTYTEAQKEYLEKAAADFNASQEEVEVVVESQEYSGFKETVYQAVMANNGPDMIIHYASEASMYVDDNKVVDLSKYLSPELVGSLDKGALEEATSFADGGMHVFPIVLSGPVLFYNPDLLSAAGVEVPTTWEALEAAAKTVSEKLSTADKAVYGFAADSKVDVAQTWMMQAGATVFNTQTKACEFGTDTVKALLKGYQDGVANNYYLPNPTLSDYFSDDYNTESLAMYVGSVAGAPYLKANWEVAPVPQLDGGTPWTPAWNRGVIVFNYEDELRAAASAKFIEYFATPEVNAGWCQACNYMTSLSSTRDNETYKTFLASEDKGVAALNALRPEIAGSFPAIAATAYVRTALETLMSEVASGVEVDTAVQNAYGYVAGEVE